MLRVKLYGNLISQPTRTLNEFCLLCNIPYDFIKLDIFNWEHKAKWYAEINPYQLIPSISHGDFKLGETFAIIPYLAEYYHVNNQWYPSDLQKRSLINAYFHWQHLNIRRFVRLLVFEKFVGPMWKGLPPITSERETEIRADIAKTLQSINDMLDNGKYIGRTQELSIADIACYNEIAQMKIAAFNYSDWPKVKLWMEEIEKLEAVKTTMVGFKEVVDSLGFPSSNIIIN
ncbi:unnamed protein product [Blepharisma stoltei]|uniref:Glutathione S-transferase n=1 Tax=Blepharisma stoltei TaxID=1481888 RepID=A0AAU9JNX1_9CILI|nr:unnamed protein product [Blepharisma stoltei]